MKAVWGKRLKKEMNVTLAFTLSPAENGKATLEITASSAYRLFVGGRLLGCGPARAAYGYVRIDSYEFETTGVCPIVAEVAGYNINSDYLSDTPPFFAAELKIGGVTYNSGDFGCRRITDRVQRVQRYSFKKAFAECYKLSFDKSRFYSGEFSLYPGIKTEPAALPALLKRRIPYPSLATETARQLGRGRVEIDESAKLWKDRSLKADPCLKGFPYESLEVKLSDEVCRLKLTAKEGSGNLADGYAVFDFGRVLTGFADVTVKVKRACALYLTFGERLTDDDAANHPDFSGNCCCPAVKWELPCGEYELMCFEPYAMRYAAIAVIEGSAEVSGVRMIKFENSSLETVFSCADKDFEKIERAAAATLWQNVSNLLTNCPLPECAGKLAGAYFSSDTEALYTGKRECEAALLENYALAPKLGSLPESMMPMCYPSACPDGKFIPNRALWYILELEKYVRETQDARLKELSRKRADEVISYFSRFENEYGLLEDSEGWIFKECSAVCSADYAKGVNFPSNMCYASALEAYGRLYAPDGGYAEKAESIRERVRSLSFNGRFFEDNAVRENGRLTLKGHITETCQYYAFWFGVASFEKYASLYGLLRDNFGPGRSQSFMPELARSNAFGDFMRKDLMMRRGEYSELLEECRKSFLPAAKFTGTLQESSAPLANCGSYVFVWLVRALTGFKEFAEGEPLFDAGFAGIDCKICIPTPNGRGILSVNVINGLRKWKVAEDFYNIN